MHVINVDARFDAVARIRVMSSPPLSVPVTGIKTNDYTKTGRYCILDKDLMAAHLADEEIDYHQSRQLGRGVVEDRAALQAGFKTPIKISDSNCNIAISGNYFHLTRIEHRRKKNAAPTKSLH